MAAWTAPPDIRVVPISSISRSWLFVCGTIFPRGPAADVPTAAGQEDLANKACRGQPMVRPRPPAEWEFADAAEEAVGLRAGPQPEQWSLLRLRIAFDGAST